MDTKTIHEGEMKKDLDLFVSTTENLLIHYEEIYNLALKGNFFEISSLSKKIIELLRESYELQKSIQSRGYSFQSERKQIDKYSTQVTYLMIECKLQ